MVPVGAVEAVEAGLAYLNNMVGVERADSIHLALDNRGLVVAVVAVVDGGNLDVVDTDGVVDYGGEEEE